MNHVLPAWDIVAGLYLCTALLAAERARRTSGHGQEVTLSLADTMLATVSNLGYVADVQVNGVVRQPLGNDLYGAFGRDFPTADGRHVMLAAISNRQWRAIGKATGLADRLAMVGPLMQVDMATEGGRFAARGAIVAVLEPWFAQRTLAEVRAALDGTGVLWGAVPGFRPIGARGLALLPRQTRCLRRSSSLAPDGCWQTRRRWGFRSMGACRPPPRRGWGRIPRRVLTGLLGMPAMEYAKLHDAGIVASAASQRG